MSNATRIEQLRKQRRKRRLIRNLIFLGIIVIAVVTVVLLWHNQRVQDEVEGYVDELANVNKGFPRSLPVGELEGLYDLDNNCVVLTDSNLAIYNTGGGLLYDQPHALSKARVSTNRERIALYSRGGREITIRSKDTELYKKSFDYAITTAILSEKNKLAVVTGSQTGGSLVTVLDPELHELYRYSSTSAFVTGVSFSPDENRIAVTAVNTEEGQLVSTVTLFEFSSEEPLGRYTLQDQLILSTCYKDDRIYLIGEKSAITLDTSAALLSEYTYSEKTLYHYSDDGDYTVLVLGGAKEDLDVSLIVLDENKAVLSEVSLDTSVKQLFVKDDLIYLLCDEKVLCYQMDGNLRREMALQDPVRMLLVTRNGTIYAADASNIGKLE